MATRRSCRRALRHAEPSFRHPHARVIGGDKRTRRFCSFVAAENGILNNPLKGGTILARYRRNWLWADRHPRDHPAGRPHLLFRSPRIRTLRGGSQIAALIVPVLLADGEQE